MWNRVAAILEVLYVLKKATMQNDHPYKVRAYSILNPKNMNMLTFLKMTRPEIKVTNADVIKDMQKKSTSQDIKYVPSSSPIIFIPSLALDSFSAAIFEVR